MVWWKYRKYDEHIIRQSTRGNSIAYREVEDFYTLGADVWGRFHTLILWVVAHHPDDYRLLSIINFLPILCTGPAILHWTISQKNEIQILSHTNFYLLVFLGHQISVSWSVQIQKCLLLPEVVAPIMAINLLSCIILALTTYRVFGTEISTIDCGTITAKLESRMSGGEKTDRGQWPFLAALFTVKEEENDFYCGGSLISPRHVLTGIVACTFY